MDSIDFSDFEEFSSLNSSELEMAESFSVDGSSDFEMDILDEIN